MTHGKLWNIDILHTFYEGMGYPLQITESEFYKHATGEEIKFEASCCYIMKF